MRRDDKAEGSQRREATVHALALREPRQAVAPGLPLGMRAALAHYGQPGSRLPGLIEFAGAALAGLPAWAVRDHGCEGRRKRHPAGTVTGYLFART